MRIRPGKDDKILLAWNALAIEALARAGATFSRPDYLAAAVTGYEFLRDRLRAPDGRWFHVWRDQCAEVDAFLDDYAYLANALLILYECSGDRDYLRASNELVELVLHEFSDDGRAGFFYTRVRSERLVARMKDWTDHSLPSGNGMMATLLYRLAGHLDREDYRRLADGIVRACGSWIERAPHAVGQTLIAADTQSVPREKWTFTTDSPQDARLQRWLEGLRAEYAPHRILEVVWDRPLKDKHQSVDKGNGRPEVSPSIKNPMQRYGCRFAAGVLALPRLSVGKRSRIGCRVNDRSEASMASKSPRGTQCLELPTSHPQRQPQESRSRFHSELRPRSSWEKIIHSRKTVFCLFFAPWGCLAYRFFA